MRAHDDCDIEPYQCASDAELACLARKIGRVQRARRRFFSTWFLEWTQKYKLALDEESLHVFVAMLDERFGYQSRQLAQAARLVSTGYGIYIDDLLEELRARRKKKTPQNAKAALPARPVAGASNVPNTDSIAFDASRRQPKE